MPHQAHNTVDSGLSYPKQHAFAETHTAKSTVRNGVEFVGLGPNHIESIKISSHQLFICILFFDNDGDSHHTESTEGDDSDGSECKGNGAKHPWYNLTYYTRICLEGLMKTTCTFVDD